MSIETLIQDQSIDQIDLIARVKSRQKDELQKGHSMSRLGALADLLESEGKAGLLDLAYRGHKAATQHVDIRRFQKSIISNFSAIFLGDTIHTIESCLVDKFIDLPTFKSRFESALSSVGIEIEMPEVEASTLRFNDDINEWETMINAAKEDPTLAVFLENPDKVMPEGLKKYLLGFNINDVQLVAFIKMQVLGHYKSMANAVLESS